MEEKTLIRQLHADLDFSRSEAAQYFKELGELGRTSGAIINKLQAEVEGFLRKMGPGRIDEATRRGLISDLGAFVEVKARSMSEARDKKEDEIENLKALSKTLIANIADRDKEIAELKETARGRRDPELGQLADQVERLERDLADRENTIRRLVEDRDKVVQCPPNSDGLDGFRKAREMDTETIAGLQWAIKARDKEIAELKETAADIAGLRPGIVAAPGSVLIKLERSADPLKMRDDQTVGRIYDAEGSHYSPGFGVKAVVVGRSGSDVLREMSENWSRAGFME